MPLKTRKYEMFKFREDNRAQIDQNHVRKLADSISSRNLLELRPIIVNEDYEILDGQHRLLAAQLLNLEIYYEMNKKLEAEDIITMNISKSWSLLDFMNFHCTHGKIEYQKLQKFMAENSLSLRIALSLTMGDSYAAKHKFKIGEYDFKNDFNNEVYERCWNTIEYIKKYNGSSVYTSTARFWNALLKLVNHIDFNENKWKDNLSKMIERLGPRARTQDYLRMLMDIYNYKNPTRIDLIDK